MGLSKREIDRFSISRLILALRGMIPESEAGLELEASGVKSSHHANHSIPLSRLHSDQYKVGHVPVEVVRRDLTAGGAGAGAELVEETLMANSYIDILRNRTQVVRAGATLMTDLVGNIQMPRQTVASQPTWLGEGDPTTQSDAQFDQVPLRPRTLGVHTAFSRQLMLQSTPDVDSVIMRDFAGSFAVETDRVALYGTGASNQPRGVANTTGIKTPGQFSAPLPSYQELLGFPGAIDGDNALAGGRAFILNPPR